MYCCRYCSQPFSRNGLSHHEASCKNFFVGPAYSGRARRCKLVASAGADAARLQIAEYEADVLDGDGDGDGEVGANGDTAIGAYARAHRAEIKLLVLCREFDIPRRGADELIDWHHNNGHLGLISVQSIRAGLERTVSAA